ncbi:hypothetical protein M8818_006090 [Zalaria obscura]|uniref:Uncharacterized protein n=1 Tax=Zalaria obscura TaxID=2024903 RepID=A0ACC3S8S8_9PEZI
MSVNSGSSSCQPVFGAQSYEGLNVIDINYSSSTYGKVQPRKNTRSPKERQAPRHPMDRPCPTKSIPAGAVLLPCPQAPANFPKL